MWRRKIPSTTTTTTTTNTTLSSTTISTAAAAGVVLPDPTTIAAIRTMTMTTTKQPPPSISTKRRSIPSINVMGSGCSSDFFSRTSSSTTTTTSASSTTTATTTTPPATTTTTTMNTSSITSEPIIRTTTSSSSSSSSKIKNTMTTAAAIRTPMDFSNRLRQLYIDLENPDNDIYHMITPTIRFSYVSMKRKDDDDDDDTTKSSSSRHRNNRNNHNNHNKPIVIYLPGLDGYGISASTYQFHDLSQTYEFWRCTILSNDRSTFHEVVNAITQFIMRIQQKQIQQPQQKQQKEEEEEDSHSNSSCTRRRKVILIGESCGGLLASAVAIRLRNSSSSTTTQNSLLDGLVLVNPATSFEQTSWEQLVPILTSLDNGHNNNNNNNNNIIKDDDNDNVGTQKQQQQQQQSPSSSLTQYSVIGSLILAALIPDREQQLRIFRMIRDLPSLSIPPTSMEQIQQLIKATSDGFSVVAERLPPPLLEHRIQKWLIPGCRIVNERISEMNIPTLIIAGKDDVFLPSSQEAERLMNSISSSSSSKCETLIVPNRGHLVLDDSVNITEAILFSKILDPYNNNNDNDESSKNKKKPYYYDPVLDWKPPTVQEIHDTIQNRVKPFRAMHSPIFISTDQNTGKRWMGLSKIPRPDGPLLFVGNHQLSGLDMSMIVGELLEQRNILPRGLAHPILFQLQPPNELQGRTPGLNNHVASRNDILGISQYQQFGSIQVSPRNFYKLMSSGQDGLLFPGGAKEAQSGNKTYPLYWPEKVDFVRICAKFNATIIPFSAIGMIDSTSTIIEPKQIAQLPLIGKRYRNLASNFTAARYDEKGEDELIGIPISIPNIPPSRNYFLFGKPISTYDIDPKYDKETKCRTCYNEVQKQVRNGIDELLKVRQYDPYYINPTRRALYERIFGKKAPTFPIHKLNEN